MTIDDYTNTDICTKCRFHNDKQCSGVDSDKIHCYYYLIEMLAHIDVKEDYQCRPQQAKSER